MQNKHILIVLKFGSFFGYSESIIKELSINNKVTLCIQDKNKIDSSSYYIDKETNDLILENIDSNKKVILAKESDNFKIINGIKRKDSWANVIKIIRETLNYLSYLIRDDNNTFLENQSKYVSKKILNVLNLVKSKILLKLIFYFLKFIHYLIPSSKDIKNFIKDINPDLVLIVGANWPTRNEKLSSEIDFVKASKEIKKPSVLLVISWDNLIARGLYHYTPTVMFVWNETHFEEAVNVQKIPKHNLKIIGAPFMDKWFEEIKILPKKEFFKSIGMNVNKPLVTYLGSAKNISTSEKIIVEDIYKELLKLDIQLIVRPHGANTNQFKNLNKNIKIFPLKGELPDTNEAKESMVSSLRYSDFSVGINTTAMIDSIILGTPCISVVKDEFKYNQVDTPHFNKVRKEGIFIEAHNNNEIVNNIKKLNINNNDNLIKNMNKFVMKFCRPYGDNISAGKKALIEIEKLIINK
tara:strand:- start:659 stop:2059 length:1401 start_codon:yes stop_codon:yes gene_type:complete